MIEELVYLMTTELLGEFYRKFDIQPGNRLSEKDFENLSKIEKDITELLTNSLDYLKK